MSLPDSHCPPASHYQTLGVDETASLVDIRRAYRRLALRHHPDRAGPEGKAMFIRISAAYQVLSNSIERAAYDTLRRKDHRLDPRQSPQIDIGPDGRPIVRYRHVPGGLHRLMGAQDDLLRSGAMKIDADGTLVFFLTPAEMRSGGTAVVDIPLSIRCPTCGGISRPNGFWCRRCECKGLLVQPVSVMVPIPAAVVAGTVHLVSARQMSEVVAPGAPPIHFRFEAKI